MTNPRVYEVTIVLLDDSDELELTGDQAGGVIDAFEPVRYEATKWRLKTQCPGRLLLFEPGLVAAIKQHLAHEQSGSRDRR